MKVLHKPLPFRGLWEPTLFLGEEEEWDLFMEELKGFFRRGYVALTGADKPPPHLWRWFASQLASCFHQLDRLPERKVFMATSPNSGEVVFILPRHHPERPYGLDPEGARRVYMLYRPSKEMLTLHLLLEGLPGEGWRAWAAWKKHEPWTEEVFPFCEGKATCIASMRSILPEGLFPWGYRALGKDEPIWDFFTESFARKVQELGLSFPPGTFGFYPLGFGVHLLAQRADDPPYRVSVWLEEEGVFIPVEEFTDPFAPYKLPFYLDYLKPCGEGLPGFIGLWDLAPLVLKGLQNKRGLGEDGLSSPTDLRRLADLFGGREPLPQPIPEELLLKEGFPVPEGLADAVLLLPGVVAVLRNLSWGKKPFILFRGKGGRIFSFSLTNQKFWFHRKWAEGGRVSRGDFISSLRLLLGLDTPYFHLAQALPKVHERLEALAHRFSS